MNLKRHWPLLTVALLVIIALTLSAALDRSPAPPPSHVETCKDSRCPCKFYPNSATGDWDGSRPKRDASDYRHLPFAY